MKVICYVCGKSVTASTKEGKLLTDEHKNNYDLCYGSFMPCVTKQQKFKIGRPGIHLDDEFSFNNIGNN